MSNSIISIENISKSYLLGHRADHGERYTALRDILTRHAKSFFRKGTDFFCGKQIVQGDEVEEFWALKGVSFDVQQGDVVGIIGRNGAGKSTLLKILSRITEPTSGRIALRGRVASLLEVGTGFHPELTGRENIFLNGAILGMGRLEIKRKFDEIVNFAEIEKFLDTPVKRYSSGMYVRLAFAVAAHLDPEILIVDEVLAVGDITFQEKCLGRMRDVANSGRTVLFVSHNMGAVASLCSKGITLERGVSTYFESPQQAIQHYLNAGLTKPNVVKFTEDDPASSDNYISVLEVSVNHGADSSASQGDAIMISQAFEISVKYRRRTQSPRIFINFHLHCTDGTHALATIQNDLSEELFQQGIYTSRVLIPRNFLNSRSYNISLYASSFSPTRVHVELRDILLVSVIDEANSITRQGYNGPFPGVVRPEFSWVTQNNEN